VFESVFREYGLPEAIRTDNGAPFASKAPGGLSRLSMWWLRLGIQHAGENIANVLRQRAKDLSPVIQMWDALSRNVPKLPNGVEILVANCVAHERRRFVEGAQNFPEAYRHVLEMLGEVYRYDAEARDGALTAAERLRFHQEHSGRAMEKLHCWLEVQFAERKTEPNSGWARLSPICCDTGRH
jgi:hypothetical protein